MAVRDIYPEARIPDPRISVTLKRGARARTIALRPPVFYGLVALGAIVATWYLCATLYLVFRDNLLAALMNRGVEMQYSYEQRIATLRAQLESETSRQLVNQTVLEAQVKDLANRQTRIADRATIVAALARRANLELQPTAAIRTSAARPVGSAPARARNSVAANPLLAGEMPTSALPQSVNAFAPAEPPRPLAASKPHPERFDLRLGGDLEDLSGAPAHDQNSFEAVPPDAAPPQALPQHISSLMQSLGTLEHGQLRVLADLQVPAVKEAGRIRAVLAEVGLSPDKLDLPYGRKAAERSAGPPTDVGGPFVPLKDEVAGSPFEQEVMRLQGTILALERLRRIIPFVPLRQPLPGQLEVSSAFGARLDPFVGRPALHTGVDLRGEFGTPVHATAAGRVVIAERDGGYGNMVEIDHGNGLSTRYAHLSTISVSQNQWVEPGQVVGNIGATGRATGPHLHYETRINGEPVDPTRFLKASLRLHQNI